MTLEERSEARPVVIKVGGSLLELPELPGRVAVLVARFESRRLLLVPGGGRAADLVRSWDQTFRLGEEISHRLALEAMELNGRLLADLLARELPGAVTAGSREEIERAWRSGGLPVLQAARFLEAEEPKSRIPLPHRWSATSDSIAAWVAIHLGASELVLAKSAPPAAETTLEGLAKTNYVDTTFPQIAEAIEKVSAIDLRGSQ